MEPMERLFFVLVGVLVGFLVMSFADHGNPSRFNRQVAICEYKGGKVQGKVCVIDDYAINLDFFTKDLK